MPFYEEHAKYEAEIKKLDIKEDEIEQKMRLLRNECLRIRREKQKLKLDFLTKHGGLPVVRIQEFCYELYTVLSLFKSPNNYGKLCLVDNSLEVSKERQKNLDDMYKFEIKVVMGDYARLYYEIFIHTYNENIRDIVRNTIKPTLTTSEMNCPYVSHNRDCWEKCTTTDDFNYYKNEVDNN